MIENLGIAIGLPVLETNFKTEMCSNSGCLARAMLWFKEEVGTSVDDCGERCPLAALIFLTALSFPGVSLRRTLQPPSKCVRHWASLFHPLCSSLVPGSRRSISEPILARPSCCYCFLALSLPCPCFVNCGERWSAPGRVWTFFHSFPPSCC